MNHHGFSTSLNVIFRARSTRSGGAETRAVFARGETDTASKGAAQGFGGAETGCAGDAFDAAVAALEQALGSIDAHALDVFGRRDTETLPENARKIANAHAR